MTLELYLIRHAQSVNNIGELIGGQAKEVPLTELGRTQAAALGKYLGNAGFDRIYCSTAIRAIETANIALNNDPKIFYSDQLLEISQGDWVGKARNLIYTPEVRKIIEHDPLHFHAPNGESQLDVERRGMRFLETEVDYYSKNDRVAVFAHGMLFKCMLHGILGFDPHHTYKIQIDNTSITKLSHDDKGWHANYINATPHLSLLEVRT